MTKAKQLGITEFPYEEFDSNGNITYSENLNHYWYKYEYDSNGNQIYYENSDGDWVKSEYDTNNNQVYFEHSDSYGWFRYYEGDKFIKQIIEGGYKEHYLSYKRNLLLNTLLND